MEIADLGLNARFVQRKTVEQMMQTAGSTTLFLVPKGNVNQLPLFDPVSFRPFEIWKTIPGYNERYEASSEGRVRRVSGKRVEAGQSVLLSTFVGDGGYIRIGIMRNDGKPYKPGLHVLVAAAFFGPCPAGYEIDHVDTDKTNNCPGNLEYITHAENMRRAKERNAWQKSSATRSPTRQLTDEQVMDVRSSCLSQRQLAAQYGVSQVAIHYIQAGHTYRHVPMPEAA